MPLCAVAELDESQPREPNFDHIGEQSVKKQGAGLPEVAVAMLMSSTIPWLPFALHAFSLTDACRFAFPANHMAYGHNSVHWIAGFT